VGLRPSTAADNRPDPLVFLIGIRIALRYLRDPPRRGSEKVIQAKEILDSAKESGLP
jgi:hypothetical protein